jgi:hypothetical protein
MRAFLALLQREDDWTGYLWFVVFVVLPLLARFFRWLFTRLGLLKEGDAAQAEAERRERLAQARAEREQAESEGEELWRRLARGEAAPAAPAPVPPPVVPRAESLESEDEPEPLSVLGEVSEPAEAPEESLESEVEPVSLDSEVEPVPLEVLSRPAAVVPDEAAEAAPARGPFVIRRGDLRRAIVLNEVLGPPVSERALRA